MEELEQLVTLLYSAGTPPEVLQTAQRSLQTVQKSPNGWQLAQSLLSSTNPQSQFLGAQTFIVKLNEGSNLPSLEQQRNDLILWLKFAIDSNFAPFVTRKLLGAVTKLYLSTNDWPNCPLEVVTILGGNCPLSFEFLNFLVEDSELTASDLRAKLVPTVSDLVLSLLRENQLSTSEAVKTFEAWSYVFFDQFRDLMSDLISLSVSLVEKSKHNEDEEDSVFVATMLDVLSNLYSHNWKSWPPLALRNLTECLVTITQSYPVVPPPDFAEDDVFIAISRLIIAVCQEDFEQNEELHPFLVKLAAAPIPVVDDPLSVEILEFWNQYTEEIISSGLSSSSTSDAGNTVASVISGYWPRIKLYPELRASDWEEFSSFRKDFADFIELSYPIMGSQLFDQLTNVVVSSLSSSPIDWLSVESGLYCLNGVSDIVGEDYRGNKPEFQSVQLIFQSDLWLLLPQCENNRVRQTAVNLIGCFVDFFLSVEGQPYLAVTLNYLFRCLDTESLQNTASRSIQKLCDTCQGELVDEVPAFLAIYTKIRSELRSVPHIRTVSGIACVVQALDHLKMKVEAIENLLDLVISATPSDPNVDPLEVQQTRLKCVAIIGKNIRTVDLVQPGGSSLKIKSSATNFWDNNPTSAKIKQTLREIINSSIEMTDVTSVEAICDIVRAGIIEGTGPFFLDEHSVISFIVAKSNAGPTLTIPAVLDLARFYVMSRLASVRQKKSPGLSPDEIIPLVAVVRQQGDACTSAALDLLTQVVCLAASLNVPFLDLVPGTREATDLAISGIQSSDRFVLRSSTNFWKELLGSSTVVASSSNSMNHSLDLVVGEKLIRALITQVSGNASRSDLGSLGDVMKLLIAKHALVASQILKHLVVDAPESRSISRQDVKSRSDFVAQLMLVKGGRKTSEIIQRFWLKCRGIPETYNPHTSAY